MLLSTILSQARTLANDTDSTNPFHTDAEGYALISDWQMELALELKYPKSSQTISYAVGEGGATGKSLNNDILTILSVWFAPNSGQGSIRLLPTTEQKLTESNPDWRTLGDALPTKYFVLDAITAQTTAIGPLRTIGMDRTTSEARTMRIYYVQNPAIVTAGTNSPIFPTSFHKLGVYWLAGHMLMPRSPAKSEYYMGYYSKLLRKKKSQWLEQSDHKTDVWDYAQGDLAIINPVKT